MIRISVSELQTNAGKYANTDLASEDRLRRKTKSFRKIQRRPSPPLPDKSEVIYV